MVNLSKLQRLVIQFVAGGMDYAAFRDAFVRDFLSQRQEPVLEDLVNAIECSCADLSEGDLSLDELIAELQTIAKAPIVSVELNESSSMSVRDMWLGFVGPVRRDVRSSRSDLRPATEAA